MFVHVSRTRALAGMVFAIAAVGSAAGPAQAGGCVTYTELPSICDREGVVQPIGTVTDAYPTVEHGAGVMAGDPVTLSYGGTEDALDINFWPVLVQTWTGQTRITGYVYFLSGNVHCPWPYEDDHGLVSAAGYIGAGPRGTGTDIGAWLSAVTPAAATISISGTLQPSATECSTAFGSSFTAGATLIANGVPIVNANPLGSSQYVETQQPAAGSATFRWTASGESTVTARSGHGEIWHFAAANARVAAGARGHQEECTAKASWRHTPGWWTPTYTNVTCNTQGAYAALSDLNPQATPEPLTWSGGGWNNTFSGQELAPTTSAGNVLLLEGNGSTEWVGRGFMVWKAGDAKSTATIQWAGKPWPGSGYAGTASEHHVFTGASCGTECYVSDVAFTFPRAQTIPAPAG